MNRRLLNHRLPSLNNRRLREHDRPDRRQCFHDHFTLTSVTQTCRKQGRAPQKSRLRQTLHVEGLDKRPETRQKQQQAVFSKRLVGKAEKMAIFPTKKLSENRRLSLSASWREHLTDMI